MNIETRKVLDVPQVDALGVQIFADGASIPKIRELATWGLIKGFTTNPTLMRKEGIEDYKAFALEVLSLVNGRPISFEVFGDEFTEMEEQAIELASWGPNVNVKIPVTNTRGESSAKVIRKLSDRGIALNVTAMFTVEQSREVLDALSPETPAILSIFAGRIADTGRDPMPLIAEVVRMAAHRTPKAQILWASPRELLNIFHANQCGCHIITVTDDLLQKLSSVGKELKQFSLETVAMFRKDALAAGYSI